jgi:hypothetical protein
MVVDEKYAVVLDLHKTLREIQEILTYSNKSAIECCAKLYLAVCQAFTSTDDQNGLDVLDDELRELNKNARGTWEEHCKDILIPWLTLKLVRKFRRVDVLKLLHDALRHDPSPLMTPPPETSDEHFIPLLIDQKPAEIAEEDDCRQCVVCLERDRQVYFGECGHCLVCETCYKDLVSKGFPCPLCRGQIGVSDMMLPDGWLDYLNQQKLLGIDVYFSATAIGTSSGKKIHLNSRLRQTRAAPSQSNLQELLRQMRGGA